jgi:hypothetical protein
MPRRFRYKGWIDVRRHGVYCPHEDVHFATGNQGATVGEPGPHDYCDFEWIDPAPSAEAEAPPGIAEIVARLEALEGWAKLWHGLSLPLTLPNYTGAVTDPGRLDELEQLNVRQERELDRLRGICRAQAAMRFIDRGLSYKFLMTILEPLGFSGEGYRDVVKFVAGLLDEFEPTR